MKDVVRITVLMPVYNAELYLKEAIDSILNQTFVDFEFIIINDGSTDSSDVIIKSYNDRRISYVNNTLNKGLIYSLNLGLKLAKGEYIARMDADDISFPNRLLNQYLFMEQNKTISLLGTAFVFKNTNIEVHHPIKNEDIKVKLLKNTSLAHPTVMFRRFDLIKNKLFYKDNYKSAEDYKLWTEFAMKGLEIANLSEVLLEYRLHPLQISQEKQIEQQDNTCLIRKEYISSFFSKDIRSEDIHILSSNIYKISILKALKLIFQLYKVNKKNKSFPNSSFNSYLFDIINDSEVILSLKKMTAKYFNVSTRIKNQIFKLQ